MSTREGWKKWMATPVNNNDRGKRIKRKGETEQSWCERARRWVKAAASSLQKMYWSGGDGR